MCLAVPGKIIDVKKAQDGGLLGNIGTVDFQGSRIEVSLDFTPEAKKNDWVLVHAGYAINVIDEEEAREVWSYLRQIEEGELTAREETRSPGLDDHD